MIFDIVSEPKDDAYRQLLSKCGKYSTTVLLVLRDPTDLTPDATDFLNKISPWSLRTEKKSEWPGTTMKNFSATIHTYHLSSELLAMLQTVTTGLYQWVQPELPEDLCFLGSDGRPILVTIAHERDAYVDLTEPEAEDLMVMVPQLKLRRHIESASES
jgi:hypothetical protein